jgi:hypothetical protein
VLREFDGSSFAFPSQSVIELKGALLFEEVALPQSTGQHTSWGIGRHMNILNTVRQPALSRASSESNQ